MARWNLDRRYPDADSYLAPARQIGGAIDSYLASRDADRQEENSVLAAGGERVSGPPSPMDRLRRVGRGLRTVFSDEKTGADVSGGATGNARDGVAPSRVPRMTGYVDETVTAPNAQPEPRFMTPQRFTSQTFEEAGDPHATASLATQPKPLARPGGISGALAAAANEAQYDPKPYEVKTHGGSTYRMDPSLAFKRGRATSEREHQERMEEIGERPKPLTFEQRKALQRDAIAQRAAAAEKLARLRATTGTNSAEYRAAQLELRRAEILLRSYQNEADDLSGDLPKEGVDRMVAESQPGGKQRVAATEGKVAAARGRVEGGRAAVASAGRGGAPARGPAGPAGGAKPDAATRAQELRSGGKSKQEVYQIMKAEGYNVLPPRS
jgi:hypothetical protein